MNIHTTKKNGRVYHVVSWFSDGRQHRRFFSNGEEARRVKRQMERERRSEGDAFLHIPIEDRAELAVLWREVLRLGLRPLAVLRQLRDASKDDAPAPVTLGEAFNQFMAEKRDPKQNLGKYSLIGFNSNLGRFTKSVGDEKLIGDVTRQDIVGWLKPFTSQVTFNTYLTSLKTFFRWAHLRAGLIKADPAALVDKIKRRQMKDAEVVILNAAQAHSLLAAASSVDPALVPIYALGLFGGLRPGEAQKMRWEWVADTVFVPRAICKTRDERYVEMNPTLAAWIAPHRRAEGLIAPNNLRKLDEEARVLAGLVTREKSAGGRGYLLRKTGWGQDCLRHSFGSHYLPLHSAERTIAQMGHAKRDYDTFFNYYKRTVKESEAHAFWSLRPGITPTHSPASTPKT